MDILESFNGQPTDIHSVTAISVLNVVSSMVIGRRFEYKNPEFHRIVEIFDYNVSKLKGTTVLNYFPWLRYLPGDLFHCKIIEKNYMEFYEIISQKYLKENEDVEEPENVIAAYLHEMKRKQQEGEKTNMDRPNLLRFILDLFVGGAETMSSTIWWIFLYMVNYQEIQEKIFQEINEVVGLGRSPNMEDKVKLVYTTATIMEVQRHASLFSLSLPRVVPRNVNLRGYLIPKGTEIFVNFDSVHHDPTVWGHDAGKFRPERFINEGGDLLYPESWIPFLIGKRNCLAKNAAKMELFLYVSNIIQKFTILPVDPENVPPVKGHFGILHIPLPFELRLVSRR